MTLRELAQDLGLSPTTVSRALNGYPEVAEDTRWRVMEAARRLNYRPNTRAKSLATGRAQAIGHVIPVSAKHQIVNPVFADFIAGAGESYARAGYDMVLTVVADDDEAQAYRDLVGRGTVDGMIVHGPRQHDPRIPLLRELDIPFLVHGRSSGITAPYSWLDINNRRGFTRATDALLDMGHRRIALINGLEDMDFAIRRREGYLDALQARAVRADPALMVAAEMTETNGYRAACRMLEMDNPPSAFLVSSILLAIGVRHALWDAGMHLGRDVSVITHDDDLSYLKNGDAVPLFTATRSSVREAGRLAADMLLDLVADPASGPVTRLLEVDLIVGRSTGPCPASTRKSA
ncbi:LacI family DNA-binding transcriptional regulator [Rhodobacteraceae bacterium 2376]|uniref:LacI family DNA-binding transcriptional regulator n=1 Tax=Rhabdonatronobacter sediminivivens TaxID=2743469 RepID=A0A7Z0L1E0_9RHOB|nr:substrate-binding domain-containing protein [Rhabdonatronobacter sediminivivens]NYS25838.1 LacI family DNA-binding transcriptional regulator [Rhabdonatronobacter sediminivivens]